MANEEVTFTNRVGGEISPRMYGRPELAVVRNGSRRCKNFILETQGGASYRPGKAHVFHSRLNRIMNLVNFEFNDAQAYILEFTDKKLRFYRNNGIIVESDVTITAPGISKANPGVVTATAHGFLDGDEVFIQNVVGMTEVNGVAFIVANKTANDFELTDVDGNNVDTSGFTAYSSGGVCQRIHEIDTPYTEANDLFQIKSDQDADTMYLVHPFYEPRKLTRTDHDNWSIDLFTRISDPFLDKQTITDITQANPGVVTAVGHFHLDGDVVIIETVTGMTEVNGQPYIVANKTINTYELTDLNGNNIDTSGFGVYSAGGYSSDQDLLPNSFTFYESRTVYGGPEATPQKLFFSQAPDSSGDSQFDDFTTGTNDDDGLRFTIASSKVNKILWLTSTDRLLLVGTFGTEIKVTGATSEAAITPTSITVRRINGIGVANVPPLNEHDAILYIQRGGLTVRNLDFNIIKDKFVPEDQNLVADHITETGLKQLAWQSGRPNIAWAVRNDGLLLSLTFKPSEGVSPWARHDTGATGEDKFLSVAAVSRPSSFDQIWVGVERIIDSNTRRYVGFITDFPILPERVDFFTGEENEAADTAKFLRAEREAQKSYIYLDSHLSYDGSQQGIDASATMTPAAVTGVGIDFTASAAVFATTDVGREIWKKAIGGVGEGRARITSITSPTVAVCTILDGADFDNTNAMPAGDWYLTAKTITKLDHLEGRSVGILTDGGKHSNKTVTNGSITLDYQSSRFHVGLGYEGFLQFNSLEFGGTTGSAQTKLQIIYRVGFRVLKSLGGKFGTDLYDPELIIKTKMPITMGSVQPLVTDTFEVAYNDGWSEEKLLYIRQDSPLPLNLQLIEVYGETNNE